MKFEWDEFKATSNLKKHGVDFEGAQLLWEDCNRVEIKIQSEGEQRYLDSTNKCNSFLTGKKEVS